MVFDNDAWRKTGESVQGGYEEINEEIVRRFGILFGAGEIQQGQEVAESVVDSSEIINTRSGGGVSTVGYAAEEEVEERTSGRAALPASQRRRGRPTRQRTHHEPDHQPRPEGGAGPAHAPPL